MNPKLLDLSERVGWTFVQAFAGSIAAGGTALQLQTFDWRAALVGAGVAALLSVLKVAGVNASGTTRDLFAAALEQATQDVVAHLGDVVEEHADNLHALVTQAAPAAETTAQIPAVTTAP